MYVSTDRRSENTGSVCTSSVVIGGWLLTMAAAAAFLFATGDGLRDEEAVLLSQAVPAYDQRLSVTGSALTAHRTSPRIVHVNMNTTTPAATPATPGHLCGARPTTITVARISARELTSRSTQSRSGAGISRLTASACRVTTSPKLSTAGVPSAPAPQRAAGAARPSTMPPTGN